MTPHILILQMKCENIKSDSDFGNVHISVYTNIPEGLVYKLEHLVIH